MENGAHLLIAMATICVVFIIGASVATVIYVHSADEIRRRETVASCERGNTIRQTINVIVARMDGTGIAPLPVIDCEHIIK